MLKTVKVPKEFEDIFGKAEVTVGKFFDQKEIDVTKATIKIAGERYLLVRASSLSVDFFECVMHLYRDKEKKEAMHTTRQLLFDISHAIGMKDAEHFHKTMDLKDPIDRLSAGPIHFAYTGWAYVDILPNSSPTPDENYVIYYDHPYSFEADAWIASGKKSDFPVCFMNAGYSSGWSEQSYGVPLVAVELTCRAKGDKNCHFIMAHASHIEEHIEAYLRQHPELVKGSHKFEVPGFFKIKKAEAALVEANKKLIESNRELIFQSEALLEKSNLIETLSEIGELLPACTSFDEIYEVFSNYGFRLFPQFEGRLFVYNEDKKALNCVSSWGKKTNLKSLTLKPEECFALQNDQVYMVHQESKTKQCPHSTSGSGTICLPVTAGGEDIGLITIKGDSIPFTHDMLAIFGRLAGDIGLALSNFSLRESLRELSIRDYLTGLYNRRYMEETLLQEVSKSKRNNSHFGIIMFDIDYYKDFNDTYGHETGDYVLSTIGKFLKDFFRESDIVCRFGGEEFVIILKDVNEAEVIERAEKLREQIKSITVNFKDKVLKKLTISSGIAIYPQHGRSARELLDSADSALYRAKHDGRDQLCLPIVSGPR